MQAETLTEAIVAGSPRTLVVASGRVVARDNALLTEF
jgi:hypothetical protein